MIGKVVGVLRQAIEDVHPDLVICLALDVLVHGVEIMARYAAEVERVVLLDANIPGVTLKPALELGPDNWKNWHFLFNSVPDLPEALLTQKRA